MGLNAIATYDFVEITFFAFRSFVLNEQGQIIVVEFVEPLIPFDFFERAFAGISGKVETNDPDVVIGMSSLYGGGTGVTLFGPTLDFVVIGQYT